MARSKRGKPSRTSDTSSSSLVFEIGIEQGRHCIVADAARAAAANPKRHEFVGLKIQHAFEVQAHARRPDHGRGFDLKLVGQFVQQFEGIAGFAVHLVDEGHDGNVAQAADFEQFAGLGFDALGGVDHHHGAESAAVRVR